MTPHTDFIESAAGAFSRPSRPAIGKGVPYFYGYVRGARRAHDRGTLWVRITLFLVVSALLLSVVNSSRTRSVGTHSPVPRVDADAR